jgi:uncharacterized membrane protein (DUF485 family)
MSEKQRNRYQMKIVLVFLLKFIKMCIFASYFQRSVTFSLFGTLTFGNLMFCNSTFGYLMFSYSTFSNLMFASCFTPEPTYLMLAFISEFVHICHVPDCLGISRPTTHTRARITSDD